MKTPKFFYGWFVVAACFVISVIGVGLVNSPLSLYVKPICDDLGFSRGAYALAYSITSVIQMLISLFFGKIYQKVNNLRLIFFMGVAGITSAFTIYFLADNIYLFYLGAIFQGFGIQFISTIPLSVIMSNWFQAKRGTVFSIVFAGSGIGGIILNPIVGGWIAGAGWRAAYLYSIILMLIFLIPALLILRGKPEDVGQTAYGSDQTLNLDLAREGPELTGPTFNEARKTPAFWMVFCAFFFFGIAIQPVYVNASAHLEDAGLKPTVIAYIMSVVFISNTLSKIVLGVINDRYGSKPVILINNLFFILATIILVLTTSDGLGFLFAVGFGIGYTMISITTPLLIATMYGGRDYGTIIGMMIAAQTAGYSFGTPLIGLSFDIFHTYSYAFIVAALLDLAGVVLVFRALRLTKG